MSNFSIQIILKKMIIIKAIFLSITYTNSLYLEIFQTPVHQDSTVLLTTQSVKTVMRTTSVLKKELLPAHPVEMEQ